MKTDYTLNYDTPVDTDCDALSQLVFNSKASHGYSSVFMENCRNELIVSPLSLQNGPSHLAWTNSRSTPVGFVQIVAKNTERCELEALFVDPSFQAQGLGQILFRWAITQVRNLDYPHLIINSDPGAERFYLAAGAIRIGKIPSGSIPGRFLPQLSHDLSS